MTATEHDTTGAREPSMIRPALRRLGLKKPVRKRRLGQQLRAAPQWTRKRFEPRAAVLMYHGIGDVGIDPWGLFVSPVNFEQHLQVLNDVSTPMGLRDLGAACRAGSVPTRATALTIDDGYANILHRARPMLEANGIAATLFAISRPLEGPSEYWWDELAGIVLEPGELPSHLELSALSPPAAINLGAAASYSQTEWEQDHRYRDEEMTAGPRMAFYRRLWQLLLPLDDGVRRQALDEIARWAGGPFRPRESHRSVTVDELVELDGEVVEIGGHTMTHPLLPNIAPMLQSSEIEDNKRHLESVLDRPVETFSYPFGAHDDSSVSAARAAGYGLAVTTRPHTTAASFDPHRIGRFDVKNWTGEEFERRLRRWIRFG